MKKFTIFLFVFLFSTHHLFAEDVRHTFGDSPFNSFYIDNKGGSVNNGGSNLSYYINFHDVDQSSRGTLMLYGENSSIHSKVDNGYVDDDFTPTSTIQIYPLSNLLGSSFNGEIALSSNAPFTPVTYTGANTGLTVQQISYTSYDPAQNFAIIEYRIFNPGTQSVHAILGLSNDLDIDLKEVDASAGFTNISGVPMVYQQDTPPNSPHYTTIGITLIEGGLSQYRIESCGGAFPYCSIFASDNDLIRTAFFENDPTQVGDLTHGGSNLDFATTIAADLGNIAPNQGTSAVFCYALSSGTSAANALSNTQSISASCKNFYESNLQRCQNGLINYGEECDDGNNSNFDACTNTCENAKCGDGFAQAVNAEQCDNGNLNSDTTPNACRTNCQFAHCGDGVKDTGEQCDDGNTVNTDSCTNTCQNAKCGDGFVQRSRGEVCDDGNNTNGDGCSADCLSFESCGNGTLDPGEACDDGNNNTSDDCPSGTHGTCQAAFCGDGFLHSGIEECDDGNNVDGDGCDSSCHLESSPSTTPPPSAVCGNGVLETGEECDDGNNIDLDGCTNDCHILVLQGGSSNPTNAAGGGSGGCTLQSSPDKPLSLSLYLSSLFILVVLRKRKLS